jgi:DNA-binding transcriptional regulator YiaG
MTGSELRIALSELELTQFEFSVLMGVSERSVRYWLTGRFPIPRSVSLALSRRPELLDNRDRSKA